MRVKRIAAEIARYVLLVGIFGYGGWYIYAHFGEFADKANFTPLNVSILVGLNALTLFVESLRFHLQIKKLGKSLGIARAFALFAPMQTLNHVLTKAGTLSGGEQQMLAIGRALMARPALLALDEPSLGLAPLVIAEIGRLLQKLNRGEGIGILLVEQNVRLGLSIASRIYLLELGRIVLEGAPADVRNDDYIKRAYLGG